MKCIKDIPFSSLLEGRSFHPSPVAWEEEVLYFLLLDRFADEKVSDRPCYDASKDYGSIFSDEQKLKDWHKAASRFNGGNLRGLGKQLDYLKELGITCLWISPVLKQTAFEETYHGYGIQDFLQIDPRFGTGEDLCQLVASAHDKGIHVLLDVIINHSGNVFRYEQEEATYRREDPYPLQGFHDANGDPTIDPVNPKREAAWPDGGIWPQELFDVSTFSRCGSIVDWDRYPEHIEGDFYSLKNIHTGRGGLRDYEPSAALRAMTECYKYWIAYADLDGFRLDTVKHLEPGATRWFTREIHEFCHLIGKHNFYIVGEITGGTSFAMDLLRKTGLNAALGINEAHEKLELAVKGLGEADAYFSLFSNSRFTDEESSRWLRNNVIVMFDDHDMVAQLESKRRFCADHWAKPLLPNAVFMNLFSMGIPCLYYGTEQCFDGEGGEDHYIRESMHGSDFGAFRSQGKHFFDRKHPAYQVIAQLAALRRKHDTLRYGRQYLRPIAVKQEAFAMPSKGDEDRYQGVIAWARILSSQEYVLAVNCHLKSSAEVWVLVDSTIHQVDDEYVCLIRSDAKKSNESIRVRKHSDQLALKIRVPAAGFVLLAPQSSPHLESTTNREKD